MTGFLVIYVNMKILLILANSIFVRSFKFHVSSEMSMKKGFVTSGPGEGSQVMKMVCICHEALCEHAYQSNL